MYEHGIDTPATWAAKRAQPTAPWAELISSKLRLLGGPGEKVLAVGDHEAIVKRGNEELICFDSLNTGTVPLRIFSQ